MNQNQAHPPENVQKRLSLIIDKLHKSMQKQSGNIGCLMLVLLPAIPYFVFKFRDGTIAGNIGMSALYVFFALVGIVWTGMKVDKILIKKAVKKFDGEFPEGTADRAEAVGILQLDLAGEIGKTVKEFLKALPEGKNIKGLDPDEESVEETLEAALAQSSASPFPTPPVQPETQSKPAPKTEFKPEPNPPLTPKSKKKPESTPKPKSEPPVVSQAPKSKSQPEKRKFIPLEIENPFAPDSPSSENDK